MLVPKGFRRNDAGHVRPTCIFSPNIYAFRFKCRVSNIQSFTYSTCFLLHKSKRVPNWTSAVYVIFPHLQVKNVWKQKVFSRDTVWLSIACLNLIFMCTFLPYITKMKFEYRGTCENHRWCHIQSDVIFSYQERGIRHYKRSMTLPFIAHSYPLLHWKDCP